MAELLAVPAFSRALAALFASGLAFPAIGTFILCLELVPARFAVMHVALLGAALGLLFGVPPLASALAAALAAGLLVAAASEKSPVSAGGPLGLVMTVSLGLAFIVFYKADVPAMEAFSLFWGSVLTLSGAEVGFTALAAAAIVSLTGLFFTEIKAVLYDRELARAAGRPARAVYYAIAVAVCLGMALAMRLTGALLADATTLLPALAARNLRTGLKGTLLWGSAFGLASNFGGFFAALAWDLPTGPAVIAVGAAIVAGTSLAGRLRRPGTGRWPRLCTPRRRGRGA